MKIMVKQIIFSTVLLCILSNPCVANAALVSLEGNYSDSGASLVSKETKELDLNFVIRQETDKTRGVLISYEEQEFSGTFVLRQQVDATSGALFAKPAALDMRILNIINDEKIKTIEDYAAWLNKNFEYQKDENGDNWASPDETLTRKKGDCEDFAFLSAAVLRVFGFKPKIVGLGGGVLLANHAICIFKKDSRYFWFDNTKLKTTNAKSMDEFEKIINKRSGYSYIFDIDENKRNVLSNDKCQLRL